MLWGKSRGQSLIPPERMNWLSQTRNDTQLWMCLAVLHRNLECLVHESRKLDVIKQEMARVNIILGIRELKWTGMGEFNSGNHYIYYCGQESLRRNGVALTVNKTVTSVPFQGKPFSITIIQVYAPIISAKETEVKWFYEDLQDLLVQFSCSVVSDS